jgi:hypothetical protein
MYKCVY